MPKKNLSKPVPLEELGNQLAQRGDIRVERLEERLEPRVPFPHRHDYFQLLVVYAGRGWHEIDFQRHPVRAPQVFMMKPGQVHSWKLAANSKGIIVEFTEESLPKNSFLLDLVPKVFALPDVWKLGKSEFAVWKNKLEVMRNEYESRPSYYEAGLQNHVGLLLIQALRTQGESVSFHGGIADQFKDLVEQHFRKEHGLSFYAKELKITPKQLSAVLQQKLHRSAKEIIAERCLLEAKRMLAYSATPVADIGYALGFDDPNYFSRFLRQNLRMNASLFREEAQKKKGN
ncbi:helix-turn-helix domain-containing protein [Bdellovibrio bacteriovorus]|uniref:helix-turn-helix domain-containing protein n=1 Tax=Bdellovibrio bacteriovorus TaxID=959 RepID=UPI0035A628EA